jgi:hypothetical protein
VIIIDGPTTAGRQRSREIRRTYGRDKRGRFVAGFSITGRRAAVDRAIYHPEKAEDYGSTVGIVDSDGNTYCVGCWWCEGPWTEYHTAILGKPDPEAAG